MTLGVPPENYPNPQGVSAIEAAFFALCSKQMGPVKNSEHIEVVELDDSPVFLSLLVKDTEVGVGSAVASCVIVKDSIMWGILKERGWETNLLGKTRDVVRPPVSMCKGCSRFLRCRGGTL